MKRKNIINEFNKIMNVVPSYKEVNEFMPIGKYKGILAITYDGISIDGKKTKIFAYLGFPKNCKKDKKSKAIVLVHGGGGHAYLEWVKIWNDLGYVAIAMNTCGDFPDEVNCWEREGAGKKFTGKLNGVFVEDGYVEIPEKGRMVNPEEPLAYQKHFHSIASVILARNLIASLPEVDENKIGITGISWGGVITSFILAIDNRYAFAIPIYGSAYLKESYAEMWIKIYSNKLNCKLWSIEKYYKKVKTPILWLCWNDDTCFSVNSNSRSFLKTKKYNDKTNISMVNNMLHSHIDGIKRDESYMFAESILSDGPALTKVHYKISNCKYLFTLEIDKNCLTNIKAKLYYITSKPTFSVHKKYGYDKGLWFMDQDWQTLDVEIKDNKVDGILPKNTVAYYLEVITVINGKEIVTTSPVFNF